MTKVWKNNSPEYKAEVARIEALAVNDEVYKNLDDLQVKFNKNEFRYKNDPNYEEYKQKYLIELGELKGQLK